MNPFLFSFLLITAAAAAGSSPAQFPGDVSINCGSIGTSTARNGREWIDDDLQPKSSSPLQVHGSSTTSTTARNSSPDDPVPHTSARISRSQFSYSIRVNPGQKIIRLHFNPSPYKGFKDFRDLFSVESGPFTLLSNFSASITAAALGVNSLSKEFCLNIQENQQLNLVFSPTQSIDTYAFINGIEIISVPASLSYFNAGDDDTRGVQVVGRKSMVYVDHHTALEIIDRKFDTKPSRGDSDGVFPDWAMRKAGYKGKNDTWKIAVDVGFRYLIRIHFSAIGLKILENGDVAFQVLVNGMIAQTNMDMLKEGDGNRITRYRDYVMMMRGRKKEGKQDISISLQSYDEVIDGNEFIAGFEILKLSNPDNSLGIPNPFHPGEDSPCTIIRTLLSVFGLRNAIANVAIALVSLANISFHVFMEIWEANISKEENKPSARAERLCRRFPLVQIQLATKNFSDELLIGNGGFGKVYKGFIDKDQTTVAVKRLKPYSSQGPQEFLTEIETLSELRHFNLVSLIGYCNERGEMILVYDYMARGTLSDHLYKLQRESNYSSSLTWKQRLNICIGAGRGLDYLHTGHGVIHRDVKTSNILLDENFVAKVSDFGLAKHEDRGKLQSHVSTRVKGTRGYLDPHYFNTCQITRKSDTYAFGVVLFQVLCGRPAVDSWLPEDERVLAKWGRDKISMGEVDQIVDQSMGKEILRDSLNTFVGVAERCLHDEPKSRPTMSQVVRQLELALEHQENKQFMAVNDKANASSDTRARENVNNQPQPVKERESVVVPTGGQNETASLKEKTTRKNDGATVYKSLWIWPRDTFWNRANVSKKKGNAWNKLTILTDIGVPVTYKNVVQATGSFNKKYCIDKGGFGHTYRAKIAPGVIVVAKRYIVHAPQFDAEIKTLSGVRHPNLVTLIGFHDSGNEKFLIYNFISGGDLNDFIRKRSTIVVDWRIMHQIALDISRALNYLHKECVPRVLHRDVNPSHILLDENFRAYLCGFGLSRLLGTWDVYATTQVVGTYGYVAPEYALDGLVSDKVDVYSYGVVLLELFSDKRAADRSFFINEDTSGIASWASLLLQEGREEEFFTGGLWIAGPREVLVGLLKLAVECTSESDSNRPTMKQVVQRLEQLELPPC